LARSLSEIRQTPLDHIPADDVAEVVRQVVKREPDSPTLDVAAFNSSI
jgi:FXSXX-COOH protein